VSEGGDLKPFFTYFGGKWRTAPKYPSPVHSLLIEPFAGSAGYSLRHPAHSVKLYDLDERVIGVWQYLIGTNSDQIRGLPLEVENVNDLAICQEARWLIGFWLNKGAAGPRLTPGAWMRSGIRPNSCWGEVIRERIASQVPAIRHWKAEVSHYLDVPTHHATWFIDPPYDHASGRLYREKVLDFTELGTWCRNLKGQVIVCERQGADWLPFEVVPWKHKALEGSRGKATSAEAVWINA
jgi:hypothetical protein